MKKVAHTHNPINYNRYYVQKKTTFYVERERYFEITLQLADKYATKYNRVTVYSKTDISTNYSIQVGCAEAEILLWENVSKIKVVTNWRVSIEPASLNKLAKILRIGHSISGKYGEYSSLMEFMTISGINLLDFIDMGDKQFNTLVQKIYGSTNTTYTKDVLLKLHNRFGKKSQEFGKHVVRYAIIQLREDLLEDLIPDSVEDALISEVVYLSKGCYPFYKKSDFIQFA